MTDIFEKCHEINRQIENGDDRLARDSLIQMLDSLSRDSIPKNPIVNHLIRRLGLYPYIDTDTAIWQDRVAFEAFKSEAGDERQYVLHRDQSLLLKMLLEGKDLAVSAPTSFGKSFVIDAFIAIKKPNTVVIIVPTIALMDEARRRLTKKFASKYKVITTAEAELEDRNILVFPQERALRYLDSIENIDLLIVDEFYKASESFAGSLVNSRTNILLKVILEYGKISSQRYFLAPNISSMDPSIFTEGMTFHEFTMSTVFLDVHEDYRSFSTDKDKRLLEKKDTLKKLVNDRKEKPRKSLIYAGTYTEVDLISEYIVSSFDIESTPLLDAFSEWIVKNYSEDWNLADLVKKRGGIHNGRLHRALAQIQIKLFELEDGLHSIISTSSIIEGVNTAAEQVIVWNNKNGRPFMNYFDYRNLIGRGGRMLRYFVGHVHILEKPPEIKEAQLTLDIPNQLLVSMDETDQANQLTKEQVGKIISFKEELKTIMNSRQMVKLLSSGFLQTADYELAKSIVIELKGNQSSWDSLINLNSSDSSRWGHILYKVQNMKSVGAQFTKIVEVTKLLPQTWPRGLPWVLKQLQARGVSTQEFFECERLISFRLTAVLHDINEINVEILGSEIDISPFLTKASHAFLPVLVYQLEEYGLPRMISRKIHDSGLIDLESTDTSIHSVISAFKSKGLEAILEITSLEYFDKFVITHFWDGLG